MVGTLNYDGLIHAAALNLPVSLADMSTGYESHEGEHCVVPGEPMVVGHLLRNHDNMPGNTLQLLNLHGSLGWLRTSSSGAIWKFDLSDLRDQDYWSALAANNTSWTPSLILTDQKGNAVAEYPFSLAYEIFRERLARADRWMIVGYGFGDEPVNAILRTAASLKDDLSKKELEVLVIDYEREPVALRRRVAQIVGLENEQIRVDTSGIPEAIGSAAWKKWGG
jgi:hypothetical protein